MCLFSITNDFLNFLACPTCFIVKEDRCSLNECNYECIHACESGAIKKAGDGRIEIDYEKCDSCSKCAIVCPNNAIDKASLKLIKNGEEFYLGCDNCKTLYPLKDVVYITENCNPRECDRACMEGCEQNAFFLTFRKRLKINNDKCIFCGKCSYKCSNDALISVKTPILFPRRANKFAIVEHSFNQYEFITDINMDVFNYSILLRKFYDADMLPSTALTNEYILSELVNMYKGGIIVDNGCGANDFRTFVKERSGIDIIGIDIELNRNAFFPIQFLMNGEYLPLKNNCVSIFISNFVLEHTTNPLHYLNEIYRTLKDDGKVIISVPTSYFHIAYLLRFDSYKKYGLHVVREPKEFIKNPIKDFLTENAHEKEWNVENSKAEVTFIDEIRRWRLDNWEKMFTETNFKIIKRKITGNILSLNRSKYIKMLGNPKKVGVHCTYILEKNGNL